MSEIVKQSLLSALISALAAFIGTVFILYITDSLTLDKIQDDLIRIILYFVGIGLAIWFPTRSTWRYFKLKALTAGNAGLCYVIPQMSQTDQKAFQERVREQAKKSSYIDLLLSTGHYVITLTGGMGFLSEFIGAPGKTTRVILHKECCETATERANSMALGQRGRGEPEDWTPARYNGHIIQTKSFLDNLKDVLKVNVSYVQTEAMPSWKLFIFDKICFVQIYLPNQEGRFSFAYGFVNGPESSFYHCFKYYFDSAYEFLSS